MIMINSIKSDKQLHKEHRTYGSLKTVIVTLLFHLETNLVITPGAPMKRSNS